MKQEKYFKNLWIVILLFGCLHLNAQQLTERFVPGLLHVKIKPSAEITLPDFDVNSTDKSKINDYPMLSKLIEPYKIQTIQRPYAILKTVNMENTYKIKFKKESEIEGLIEAIQKNHEIEYVEKIPVHKKSFVPNDPLYNDMWFMSVIQAAEGWDLAQNNKEVVIGVVDDAVQINHEDLQNNIWQNTAELNGTDGVDDDNNGYIDDYYGWDAVNLDGDPSPVSNAGNGYMDHGTHVAGTVGAVTNNNRGIASIANNHIKLMGARGADNQDQFTKIYEALAYTIVSGAEIVNNSWGRGIEVDQFGNIISYPQPQQFDLDFFTDVQNNYDVILVFAAGNENADIAYPAAYDFDNIVAVAASGVSASNLDGKATYSNFGSWVDIMAPGTEILSCQANGSYFYLQGTSMASPNVASLLGLMKSHAPSYSNQQLLNCLYSSADNVDGSNSSYIGLLGAGRINVLKAIQCVNGGGGGGTTCGTPTSLSVQVASELEATLQWSAVSGASSYEVQIRVQGETTWSDFGPYNTTSADFNGFDSSLTYEFRVRATCSGSATSTYSNIFSFSTQSGGGGGGNTDGCTSFDTGPYNDFAEGGSCSGAIAVTFDVWTNESYYVEDLQNNQTYSFEFCTGYNAANWEAEITVLYGNWDAGTVGDVIKAVDGCSIEFTYQANASFPDILIIVSDKNDCGGYTFQTGNGTPVFDCVSGGGGGTCSTPSGLSVSSIEANSVILNWGGATGASSYNVQARPVGQPDWIEGSFITSTNLDFTQLAPCTDYEFRVQAVCSSGQSNYSNIFPFTTTGCQATCNAPSNLSASNVTSNSVNLNWTAASGVSEYSVNYRVEGGATWNTATTTSTNYTLQNLNACLNYETEIISICNNSASTPSNRVSYETDCGSCSTPSNVAIVSISPFDAAIVWDANPNAIAYQIRAREIGTTSWTEGEVTNTGVDYTGLDACKDYEVQVKAICNAGESTYSGLVNFTTGGCSGVVYCNSQGDVSDYEWIESVQVGSLNNNSGNNFGYELFSNFNLTFNPNQSYNVSLTPGFAEDAYEEYWRIWIDINKDGDFEDSGEMVFDAGAPSTSQVTGSLTIPSNALEGETTMRIAMKWIDPATDADLPQSCTNFNYGEVEDYLINIGSGGGTVTAPTAAFSANQTSGTAPLTVNFTDQSTNSPTSWSWSFPGASSESSSIQNPTVTYNTPGTYTVVLTVSNSAGNDTQTEVNYITVTEDVVAPVASFTADVQSGVPPLTVNFTDASTNQPTAWSWAFPGGIPETSTQQNPTVVYLDPGMFTVILTVTNSAGNDTQTEVNFIDINTTSIEEPILEQFQVLPNPFENQVQINLEHDYKSEGQLIVSDLQGRVIYIKALKDRSFSSIIDMSDFASGMYILSLEFEGKIKREKLIKM